MRIKKEVDKNHFSEATAKFHKNMIPADLEYHLSTWDTTGPGYQSANFQDAKLGLNNFIPNAAKHTVIFPYNFYHPKREKFSFFLKVTLCLW